MFSHSRQKHSPLQTTRKQRDLAGRHLRNSLGRRVVWAICSVCGIIGCVLMQAIVCDCFPRWSCGLRVTSGRRASCSFFASLLLFRRRACCGARRRFRAVLSVRNLFFDHCRSIGAATERSRRRAGTLLRFEPLPAITYKQRENNAIWLGGTCGTRFGGAWCGRYAAFVASSDAC